VPEVRRLLGARLSEVGGYARIPSPEHHVLPSNGMRRTAFGLAILLFASAAYSDVLLMVRRDGTKVIYNVGSYGKGSDYAWLARQRNRHSKYDAIIDRYASRFAVDPVLVRAVIQVESDFNPNCVSHKGARGLMQLMPETARRYGVGRIHDPDENIRGGVRYLAELLQMFSSDIPRVLAAYNAGENAVARYGGIPPYEETTTYVKRALTVYYGHPYGQATSFAASRSGAKLRGGFGAQVVQPLATAVFPGMRYLGTQ
jgi:soluble lytic murein transglycosylase-like protein